LGQPASVVAGHCAAVASAGRVDHLIDRSVKQGTHSPALAFRTWQVVMVSRLSRQGIRIHRWHTHPMHSGRRNGLYKRKGRATDCAGIPARNYPLAFRPRRQSNLGHSTPV